MPNIQNGYDTSESIDEMIESLNEIDDNEIDLVITVYETVNGITSCEISLGDFVFEIDVSKSSIEISIYETSEDGEQLTIGTFNINKTSSEDIIKYVVNFNTKGLDYLYSTANDISDNSEFLGNIEYEISGLNQESTDETLTIVINQNDTNIKSAMGLEYKTNVEFRNDIEALELTDSNSVILNDLSKDTLTATMEQLSERVLQLHNKKIEQAKQDKNSIVAKFYELYTKMVEEAE